MKHYFRSRIGLFVYLTIGVILFSLITTLAQAESSAGIAQYEAPPPDWSLMLAASAESEAPALINVPVPPDKDPCLHCHIIGEETGIWTPLARWVMFGTMGLVFALGVYRSASVWRTRAPWKPLTQRSIDWVDERYDVSEPLSKILKKPVPKYATRWFYCLGGITGFLFVVQAVTGIMLAFYYKPTPEAAFASIQYIETEVRFGAAYAHDPPLGGQRHDRGVHRPHAARLHHGRIQAAARIELGERRPVAALDAVFRFHRLLAALGPASLLGDHGRF